MSETVAIVSAAGSGERLGVGIPKAFVDLGGRTMLEHAVDTLVRSGVIAHVVVAVPADLIKQASELFAVDVSVVAGGAERYETVARALAGVGSCDFILVHDAARPLTPLEMIQRVVAALDRGCKAVVPVLPVVDTIKAVDANGMVLGTPARSGLRVVQTPQGFSAELLRTAHQRAGATAVTDDASLVENLGIPVHTVAGDPLAFKVTTPLDLQLARTVLKR